MHVRGRGSTLHVRNHVHAVVETTTGATIGTESFPTTHVGLARASTWIAQRTRNARKRS